MRWPDAGIKLFPSPHRAEPGSLRQDIIDELADHLALAAEDEVVKHGRSPQGAWQRAIERFGNPDSVARKLWWDAMREKVMREWIQTGIGVVSAAVVVLVAVLVIRTQSQIVETLQRMNQPVAAVGETLEIEVRRGSETGPPVKGVRVWLFGQFTPGTSATVNLETNGEGRVKFGPIPQGEYRIELHDAQSMLEATVQHSLFAGVGSKVTLVAPDLAAQEKELVLDPPLPFANDRVVAVVHLMAEPVDGQTWLYGDTVVVGNQGAYRTEAHGSPPRGDTIYHVKDPIPKILLPSTPLELRVELALMSPDGVVTVDWGQGASEKQSFGPDAQRLAIDLTEVQRRQAEKLVKNYLFQARWIAPPLDMSRAIGGQKAIIDEYLIKAIPITEAQSVAVMETADGRATLTPRGIEKKDDYTVVGSGEFSAALKLPDLAPLNNEFPAGYRFVINFCCEDYGKLLFWQGAPWSSEPGGVFDVALQDVQTLEEGYRRYDITELVRAGAGGEAAGVLVKKENIQIAPIDRRGEHFVIVSSNEVQPAKELLPYLLVLSDTPPADL